MNGFLRHQGESFPIKYFWKNNASDSWKDYLNSFMWIRDLRGLLEQITQGSYLEILSKNGSLKISITLNHLGRMKFYQKEFLVF